MIYAYAATLQKFMCMHKLHSTRNIHQTSNFGVTSRARQNNWDQKRNAHVYLSALSRHLEIMQRKNKNITVRPLIMSLEAALIQLFKHGEVKRTFIPLI